MDRKYEEYRRFPSKNSFYARLHHHRFTASCSPCGTKGHCMALSQRLPQGATCIFSYHRGYCNVMLHRGISNDMATTRRKVSHPPGNCTSVAGAHGSRSLTFLKMSVQPFSKPDLKAHWDRPMERTVGMVATSPACSILVLQLWAASPSDARKTSTQASKRFMGGSS